MRIQRTKLLKAVPLLAGIAVVAAVVWLRPGASRSSEITGSVAAAAPNPERVVTAAPSSATPPSAAEPAPLADPGRGDDLPCDPADPRCIPAGRPVLVHVDQPAPAPAAPGSPGAAATATPAAAAPAADPPAAAVAPSSAEPPRPDISADLRQLSDASDQVRVAAAQALAASRDPRAVTALALALTRDAEPSVRREAARALGKVIDERTADDVRAIGLDALARAAASDSDLEVCVTADHALAGLPRRTSPRRASAR